MNILIIEDEARAAKRLERLIHKVSPEMIVVKKLESVRDAVHFLDQNHDISLIFADVQLADGLSFEIFKKVKINCPIIFTTAYDQYAIEAFKTNGIDYLLKPIEEERLNKAIIKLKNLRQNITLESLLFLTNTGATKTTSYKSRFIVKVGDKIKSIAVEDVKVFYSMEKATFIFTKTNRNYIIDYSLEQVESLLDPEIFFKINRKYIVSINECSNILAWTNSRLKLTIEGFDDPYIIVARERVKEFKSWLDN
jgi:DNA-binding LytR/AlgR family response regulator